ncbi:bromodomain adjacent to zinc finger domain protein 2B-like isoform X11 [Oncorhynchus keta]|nr:bromodomain adjacent to zinc finger domain protein 2B-like isoform X11 [Oncorhynchus keta]XP_035629204.2 bromodomain adjacent to zinc finger domain protein 2B-like isoform X11 [Oncorhynchus keta]XP_052377944.1 bromodomain adjacent to zinc finger domain protein 2B-like isoform X11 [Oncorhynchus keta]
MESGERLASPSSAPSSLLITSSTVSSAVYSPAPAPVSAKTPSPKCSLTPSPATLGSPLTTCGDLFRVAGDHHFNMSTVSSAFPIFNHPAFGLYTTSSGHSEFGGLGSLGMSALAAHSQLGSFPGMRVFPEWWRAAEAQGRGAAAFFPHLLGLPPMFLPQLQQSHDPSPFQARTTSKNGRATAEGVNGAVNGNSVSTVSGGISTTATMFSTQGSTEKLKGTNNCSGKIRMSHQDMDQVKEKTKEKKLCKKLVEASSDSESGSSSDISSEGLNSSESDDLDDDDDDQSNDSDDSNSAKESVKRKIKGLTQSPADSKKKKPRAAEGEEARDSRTALLQKHPDEAFLHSHHYPLHPSPQPPALPQSMALVFQSSRTREEELKQHTSVIQATGRASIKPLALVTQPRREASSSPQPVRPFSLSSSPKSYPLSSSPKPNAVSHSPKPLSLCSSPKPLSSSPKPLSLSTSSKPPSRSSSPKPPTLSPSHKPKSRTASPKLPNLSDSMKAGGRTFLDETLLHINNFKLKQEHFKQAFPLPLTHQDLFKSPKKNKMAVSSSSSLPPPKLSPETLSSHTLPSPHTNNSNLFLATSFLGPHPNGVIHSTVQDAPLALITKPRSISQSRSINNKSLLAATSPSFSMPVNLSTRTKEHSSGGLAHRAGKSKAQHKDFHKGKDHQTHLVQSLVELFRATESDIPDSKDSEDSLEDDEDDDDDEDSDDSLSESESNVESDSDGSGDNVKDLKETTTDPEAERNPLKLTKVSSLLNNTSSGLSASCSPLNLQVIKAAGGLANPAIVTSSGALAYHSTPSSSSTLCPTPPGSGKRRRVTDERELRTPLQFGWQRETRIHNETGRLQGDVAYYAPCGKKIRQYPDVMKYLSRNGISDITRDNFSFSAKIRVGDFYEAREGPQGLQWSLLTEEEVIPRILAMEGRRGRPPNPEHQRTGDESPRSRRRKGRRPNVGKADISGATDAKVLRKLEAQEMARQAAQIKMMRKLEQQAMARAAKEARKQQAIMAAEEKRKQKEQVKILKQQEKIKRIQQIQMEKELRAQQILETKRKKTEEAANAKIMEAEKRNKEKEMRRQQAVILKHQELERHRLDMERERRRQHMMLMKTMDARKKAEERERLKQEKKDEKRLNKERKLELRRLELEIAKELKKPNEDMCLADHKLLPELSRIPGLFLPGSSFSDCLMVMQFLRSFGKVLGFDVNTHVPNLSVLQEGLLNLGDSMGQVQDLLVRMLSAVVCDPGLPPGHRTKTALGDHLANVGINQDNVSEALQIYMEAHCGETELQTELKEVTVSLKTKAFQAHTPAQKASVLALLVNELSCSKSVVSEIDKNIDHMTNLRRDKWVIEGTLRKLRTIHAKKTGKRDSGVGGEETQSLGTPNPGRKRKRKGGDSEEDEDDDEDSEDQGDEDDDDDDEEERGKKGKKVETCEEEDDGDQTASVEELEKQIDKLTKQQSQIRRKLFESSHSLRSMMFGQDRYKRRYWVLPQCGGIFVEGMETGKGAEELDRERLRSTELVHMEEEVERRPEVEGRPGASSLEGSTDGDMASPDKHSLNIFLQKPGSFSKLSKLLEVAKMSPDSDNHSQSCRPVKVPTAVSSPIHPTTQTILPSSPCAAPPPLCLEVKAEPSTALFSPPYLSGNSSPGKMSSSSLQQQQLQPNDQLLRVLTEKSGHWFSLLPRSPCDESSTTTPPAFSPQSSSITRPKSPSSLSPNPPATTSASPSNSTTGINNFSLSALQQVKSGVHMMGLPFCGWPGGMMSTTLPFSASPLPPSMLSAAYHHVEGNGNPFLAASSLSSSKSKSPVPAGDKPLSAPPAVVEVAKTQDYPDPLPIPEEMLSGWWRVADMEELRSLVKALHSRGIREKALQKQIQKHMEYIAQACAKNRDVVVIDESELEENGVSEETVESWCVEEQAMEMDIAVLQQVEELERKVTSASLQVKSWMYAEPQSERGDLVYHEHKPIAKLLPAGEERPAGDKERASGNNSLVRHVNNPLDIAVTRLAELERNIERRYLKSPLSTTVQVKLDNVLGTVTVPAPAPSHNVDGEGGEEGLAPGMKVWRKAVGEVRSAAQLALCVQQLQKSIAWERSIMKVYCQLCRKGDNEELLLLCDGCDKGCHTYCHKPKITTIPDGDWFCPACISKASGRSPEKKKKQQSRAGAAGGGKRSTEVKRSRKLSSVASAEVSEDDAASTSSSTPKKWSKEPKKRKSLGEESPATNQSKQDSTSPVCGKKAKTAMSARDDDKDLNLCRVLLAELEVHQDAWPFLNPVNPKSVPGYKKVIRKPMDFSTIREKLVNSQYLNLETFIIDVNLVFDNCEKFNEDNSDIGRAGHNMRSFFQKRWTELLKQTN